MWMVNKHDQPLWEREGSRMVERWKRVLDQCEFRDFLWNYPLTLAKKWCAEICCLMIYLCKLSKLRCYRLYWVAPSMPRPSPFQLLSSVDIKRSAIYKADSLIKLDPIELSKTIKDWAEADGQEKRSAEMWRPDFGWSSSLSKGCLLPSAKSSSIIPRRHFLNR